MISLICFCDGGCNNVTKSNAYGSFKIFSDKEEVLKRTEYNFIKSSNEAEYQTFMDLLYYIKENFPENIDVKIFSDSMLLVNQVNKRWNVKADNMLIFNGSAVNLFNSFDSISLEWVTRKIIVKQLGH